MPKTRILRSNMMLLAIALADMLSTLFLLDTHQAVEANPFMAAALRGGIAQFIIVKLATLVAYVVVVEWYRRRTNPAFARIVGRFTLLAYMGIYGISFCCVNQGMLSRL